MRIPAAGAVPGRLPLAGVSAPRPSHGCDETVTGPRYGRVGPGALPAAPAERQPTLAEVREDLERVMVRDALGRHRSVARAVGELGVTRQGLSKLMSRLQIDRFNPGRDRSAQMPSR